MVVMSDEEKDVRSDFLVARPSFWSGVGRLLDLWGKFDAYNTSETTDEADMRALYSDWRVTGQDLRDAWVSYHTQESSGVQKKGHLFVCSMCGKKTLPERGVQKKVHDKEHKRWNHLRLQSR